MNRLSEETLEPVTARLREAYRGHSTTEANEALWQATRAVCVHDKHVRGRGRRKEKETICREGWGGRGGGS